MSRNQNRRADGTDALEAYFHKNWLKNIKKQIGSDLTFISHVSRKDGYFIKVRLKNENKGSDTIMYKMAVTPDQITGKDYQSLLDSLKTKAYENRSTSTL